MANKVIIYTGAPENSALDWDSTHLLSDFDPRIAQFTGLTPEEGPGAGPNPATPSRSEPNHAAWRSLSLEKVHLPTGFSQKYAVEFFTTSFHHDDGDSLDDISQFYEESIVAHQQQPPTSQLIAAEESQLTTTTSSSFSTENNTSFISNASIKPPLPTTSAGTLLSDLADIPSAAKLLAIQPQTMTCNLIVGLITLPPPRTVKTRWGSSHRLVEALVGDDTRAGFSITFWLPASDSEANPDTLAGTLATLRPTDIILLQNVALNVFSKRVYGYSLRRGLTRAHLLYRTKLDAGDAGGYYSQADLRSSRADTPVHPQLEKTRRVRDWVVRFVGRGGQGEKRGKGKEKEKNHGGARAWDLMPPVDDTQ